MIAIINYNMGNLRSVLNAFEVLGADARLVDSPDLLLEAKAIVLPGVGAFKEGMDNLNKLNFIEQLETQILKNRKPFLGICLGMQLMAKKSFEHGEHDGLGWLDFEVRRITPKDSSFRVPHMGWNSLEIKNGGGRLFEDVQDPAVVYFVHSYHLVPTLPLEEKYITSTTWHGENITASIERDNIFGVQFHPEKSQNTGLALLKNFIKYAQA